jgi:hypothetical protein
MAAIILQHVLPEDQAHITDVVDDWWSGRPVRGLLPRLRNAQIHYLAGQFRLHRISTAAERRFGATDHPIALPNAHLLLIAFGRPDSSAPLGIEPEIGIPALEDFPTELLGGEDRFPRVAHHLAAAVCDTSDRAHKIGMRIA